MLLKHNSWRHWQDIDTPITTASVVAYAFVSRCQVYERGSYHCRDKYYGRGLSEDGLHENIKLFFSCAKENRDEVLSIISDKIHELKKTVSRLDGYRFNGTSLILMYEGRGNTSADANVAYRADLRVVDFAHSSICTPRDQEGPDYGFILGLDNLLKSIERFRSWYAGTVRKTHRRSRRKNAIEHLFGGELTCTSRCYWYKRRRDPKLRNVGGASVPLAPSLAAPTRRIIPHSRWQYAFILPTIAINSAIIYAMFYELCSISLFLCLFQCHFVLLSFSWLAAGCCRSLQLMSQCFHSRALRRVLKSALPFFIAINSVQLSVGLISNANWFVVLSESKSYDGWGSFCIRTRIWNSYTDIRPRSQNLFCIANPFSPLPHGNFRMPVFESSILACVESGSMLAWTGSPRNWCYICLPVLGFRFEDSTVGSWVFRYYAFLIVCKAWVRWWSVRYCEARWLIESVCEWDELIWCSVSSFHLPSAVQWADHPTQLRDS